jgi:hypothetical protein
MAGVAPYGNHDLGDRAGQAPNALKPRGIVTHTLSGLLYPR